MTNENKIVAEYYTPLKTRQQSELQQFKNITKNINGVTQVRNRNLAIEYLSSTVNKNITKTDFSKSKDISRNSLKINMGLKSFGIKIACKRKTNRNRREQSRTKEKKNKIKNHLIMYSQIIKQVVVIIQGHYK
jgi:hypothetical protein